MQRNSISPGEKYRPRTPLSASDIMPSQEIKKIKKEEKDGQQSDGEKSDQDLVVDDACSEDINSVGADHACLPHNGGSSPPRGNGMMVKTKMEHDRMGIVGTPNSPRSSSSDRGSSSNGSTTPSGQKVKVVDDKPSTPGMSNGNSISGIPKSVVAKPPPAGYPPGYLSGPLNGGSSHEIQVAAAYAAAAAGVPVLPPNHPGGYRGVPGLPMGPYDSHPQMRAPPIGPMSGGKP